MEDSRKWEILNGDSKKLTTSNSQLSLLIKLICLFPENLSGTVAQSTTASSQSADHAINGGKDSSTSSSTCAATHFEGRPWLRLDLQAAYRVNTVVVTYRDDSVPGRTKDFQVKFGNSLQNDGNYNTRSGASDVFGVLASAL